MNIEKFKQAQEYDYDMALAEIKAGRKESHWIWYVFPQLMDLGHSRTAIYYGIKDLAEAKEYLADALLRKRLVEISEALLNLPGNDAAAVLGHVDAMKVRSCMTLFKAADPTCEVFAHVLGKYWDGEEDQLTLRLLEEKR